MKTPKQKRVKAYGLAVKIKSIFYLDVSLIFPTRPQARTALFNLERHDYYIIPVEIFHEINYQLPPP